MCDDINARELYNEIQADRKKLEPVIIDLIEQLRVVNEKQFRLEYLLSKKLNIDFAERVNTTGFKTKPSFNGQLSTPSHRVQKPATTVEW